MVLCGVSLSVRRGGIAGLRRPARWWTARVALACRCSLTVHSRRSRFAAPLDSGISPRTHALWYPSMMRLVQLSGRHFPVRRIVICALAGLLVFYNTYTLFDLYFGSGTDLYGGGSGNAYPWFERTQSILRVIIIFSLVFVVMNRHSHCMECGLEYLRWWRLTTGLSSLISRFSFWMADTRSRI